MVSFGHAWRWQAANTMGTPKGHLLIPLIFIVGDIVLTPSNTSHKNTCELRHYYIVQRVIFRGQNIRGSAIFSSWVHSCLEQSIFTATITKFWFVFSLDD